MADKNMTDALSVFKSAIANDANIQIAQGKNALLRFRPYVDAYASATKEQRVVLLSQAGEVLNAARDRVIAHLEADSMKGKDAAKMVAEIGNTRTSEFGAIMRLGEYDCYKTVLGYFKGSMLNSDDVLGIARFVMIKPVKGKPRGEAHPTNRAAPSKTQCISAMLERRAKKQGGANGGGKKTARARDITKAKRDVLLLIKGFKAWLNKSEHKNLKAKADKPLDAMLQAAIQLEAIAG